MSSNDCDDTNCTRKVYAKSVKFGGGPPVTTSSCLVDPSEAAERQPLLASPTKSLSVPHSRSSSITTSPYKSGPSRGNSQLRTSRSYQSVASAVKTRGLYRPAVSILEKERIWYDNYTAIDWNRDNVLSRRRIESLRQEPGIRGRLFYMLDAIQGWVLCFLSKTFLEA